MASSTHIGCGDVCDALRHLSQLLALLPQPSSCGHASVEGEAREVLGQDATSPRSGYVKQMHKTVRLSSVVSDPRTTDCPRSKAYVLIER